MCMLGRPRTHPEPEFTSACGTAESKEQSLQKPIEPTVSLPIPKLPSEQARSAPADAKANVELAGKGMNNLQKSKETFGTYSNQYTIDFQLMKSGLSEGESGFPEVGMSMAQSEAGNNGCGSIALSAASSLGSILPSASHYVGDFPCGDKSESKNARTSYMGDAESIRILEPVKRSRRVETKNTIASTLLGKGSRLENLLFRMAVQKFWTSRLLWSLWLAGVGLGLSSLIKWIDVNFVWCSVFMLPLPGFTVMVLSMDLVLEVLTQFEYYLITSLQVFLATASAGMLHDRRIVFWACLMPSMLIATLIDAYPHRYRRIFSVMFFSAMQGMLLFWGAALTFRLVPLTDSWFDIAYLEGKVASMCCSSMVTLSAFCCRHLFVSIWKPDQFVLILGSVRTVKVHVKAELNQGEDGNLQATYVRMDRRHSALSVREDGPQKGDASERPPAKDESSDSLSGLSEASSVPSDKSSGREPLPSPDSGTAVASPADGDVESGELLRTVPPSDGNRSGSVLEQAQATPHETSEVNVQNSPEVVATPESGEAHPLERALCE